MIAKILTYLICGFFLFCAYRHMRDFMHSKNVDRALPYALVCMVVAFAVAVIGGI